MNHIQITFFEADGARREQLMAELQVTGIDFEGFEETEESLLAYVEERQFDREAIEALATGMGLRFELQALAERNWNAEWEKNFEPVIIDGFCSVRADFHPEPENVQYDIVITPKMSFGTGHHATTALMMTLMRELELNERVVLDFGTGTGILAILAELLGAASVLGIDNDSWSYENAVENCERNQAQRVTIRQAVLEELDPEARYDVILANINRHILLQYMDRMAALLRGDQLLLLSGILTEDIDIIRESAAANGFSYIKHATDRNWVCMLLQKQG
ncbi:50S ribosomal protein L11 methyltransferase [Taibaiella chishuiensis]|uniref:Ribosomal protein L11 methyltransferase n=1 Tax=Taibaiella chishuiensis TaxID=1434707 RepID=A0A2P8DAD0_9BACT|nr:50S ribosomal protein L11 methyltransferase [Taibaiella chishuiensis]PSK94131.1 ribosomal protein L11 methyltransferase [Taibaiella chishuiensis]